MRLDLTEVQVSSSGITFGIVTAGDSDEKLLELIESIRQQCVPLYEIIIVGNTNIRGRDIVNVTFREHPNKGWITKKKNLIAQRGVYETLVLLHDYFRLDSNWYKGISKFAESNKWQVAGCRILTSEGKRFHDYIIWIHNKWWLSAMLQKSRGALLPYRAQGLSNYIYLSGSLIICKRHFLLQNPFDEKLYWGDAEDVEWSLRVRHKWNFCFISESLAIVNKKKELSYKKTNLVELILIYLFKFYEEFRDLLFDRKP